jgi:Uma2 family endonuclease
MSSTPLFSSTNAHLSDPEYVWEIATMFPAQGAWSEEAYLDLTDGSSRRIEFTDGRLEFMPMPTEIHQELIEFLYRAFYSFVHQRNLGKVHLSGLRVRIRPNKVREPDVLFLHKNNFHMRHNRVWDGADIAIEVVSDDPSDRKRDYEEKLVDYAEGGINEYWIVDYERKLVLIHQLEEGNYVLHGTYTLGQQAASVLLDDFSIDVTALFAVVDDIPE